MAHHVSQSWHNVLLMAHHVSQSNIVTSAAIELTEEIMPASHQQRGGDCLQVEVTDVATGTTWYFAAECWLDAAQVDGATERLLLASDKDPWADRTAYKVRT
jgi:hypothetical protein